MILTETGDVRKAVLTIDGTELEEELVSVSYTGDLNGDESRLRLGSAVSCWVKLKLKHTTQIWKNRRFALNIGEIPLGTFQVTEVSASEGETELTAYDAMTYALERSVYLPDTASTAKEVLAEIAGQTEVGLGDLSAFEDMAVTGILEGYTCREMAGYMAALLGGCAQIDREGRLTVRWYEAAEFSVDADRFYQGELKAEDKDFSLEGIRCTVTTQTTATETDEEGNETQTQTSETVELTAGSELAPLTLEVPFMTQERLDSIFQTMEGWRYRPLSVTFLGDLRLEAGDQITVTDTDGTGYTVPVMSVVHSWDGGVRTTVKAVGISETESTAGTGGSLTQQVQRLTADVAAFQNLAAQNLTATNAKISNLRADQAIVGSILTDDLTAVQVNATKYLTGATIIGDLIKAGTLSAQKIILEGPDGLFYELNAKAGTLTAEQLTDEQYQQKLDGSVLAARSITADKLSVTDLIAFGATIGGWEIREDGLYHEMEDGAITIRPAEGIDRVIEIYTDDADGRNTFFVDTAARMGVTVARVSELVFQNPGAMEVEDPVMGMLLRYGTADGAGIRCTSDFHVDDVLYNGGLAVPKMQHGRLASTAGQTATAFSVTFPTAFEGVPDVTLTPRHNSTIRVFCKLKTVTATGFTGDIYVDNTGTNSVTVHWMAMY